MSAVEDAFSGLLDSPVWVAWDASSGRKIPKSPSGGNARSNDPSTWGTYEEAVATAQRRGYSGIGVMLSDGIVGIDLDGVVSADGIIADWAQKVIDDIGSYAETSPSRTGVHILAYADPEKVGAIGRANHRVGLEIYNHGRYFTVTGNRVNDKPISDRTSAVADLLAERFPAESAEDRLRRGIRRTVEDQVRRRANQTMRRNADRDGLRYARVPMGAETCASYDLAAHEALRAAGHEVIVRKVDAPEWFSKIDLLLDGKLCELKSPTSDASGINGLRFIERNIRKAVKQSDKVEGGPVRPSIVG